MNTRTYVLATLSVAVALAVIVATQAAASDDGVVVPPGIFIPVVGDAKTGPPPQPGPNSYEIPLDATREEAARIITDSMTEGQGDAAQYERVLASLPPEDYPAKD